MKPVSKLFNMAVGPKALLVLLVLAVIVPSVKAAQYPLADKIPADAIMYRGFSGQTIAFDGSYAGQLISEMDLGRLFNSIMTVASVEIPDEDARFVVAEAGKMAALAIKHPIAGYMDSSYEPALDAQLFSTLIIDLGRDKEAFSISLNKLFAFAMQQEDDLFGTKDIGGKKFFEFGADESVSKYYAGFIGQYFIVASGQSSVEAVEAVINSPESSLARNAEFISAMSSLGDGEIVNASYIEIPAILSVLEKQLVFQGEIMPGKLQAIAGLAGFSKAVSAVSCTYIVDRRFFTRTKLISPAPHEGVMKLLAPENSPSSTVSDLPADSSFMLMANIDLNAALNEIRRIAVMQDPQAAGQIEKYLQMASSFLGMSIEEKILSNLGPRMMLVNSPSVGGMAGFAVMADIKDAVAFGDVIKRLEGMALGLAQSRQMQGDLQPFTLIREKVTDTEMTILKLTNKMPIPVSPTWAIADGKFVFGLWPQTVKTIITGEIEMDMAKSGSFNKARAMLSGKPTMLAYCDGKDFYRQVYVIAEMAASAITNYLGHYDKQLSPTWMPTLAQLEKLPASGILGLWADDSGITIESCGGAHFVLPAYITVIPVIPISIILPAVGQLQEMSRLSNSQINLRCIEQGITLFELEYQRRPTSLDELPSLDIVDPKRLLSPIPDERYEYINLPEVAPDDMIWAYDTGSYYQGIPALLHSGAVSVYSQAEFEVALSKTKEYMAQHSKQK